MTNPQTSAAETTVRRFIDAFGTYDLDGMAACLASDGIFYITNATGGVTPVNGRDAFMESIAAMNIGTVKPRIQITQLVSISDDQAMVMVEIKAERKGRPLHNFAAFLIDVADDLIIRLHMVEALPAYSDAFWKD